MRASSAPQVNTRHQRVLKSLKSETLEVSLTILASTTPQRFLQRLFPEVSVTSTLVFRLDPLRVQLHLILVHQLYILSDGQTPTVDTRVLSRRLWVCLVTLN